MYEVNYSILVKFICGVSYFHGDKQAFKVNQFKCHVQISLFGAYSLKLSDTFTASGPNYSQN